MGMRDKNWTFRATRRLGPNFCCHWRPRFWVIQRGGPFGDFFRTFSAILRINLRVFSASERTRLREPNWPAGVLGWKMARLRVTKPRFRDNAPRWRHKNALGKMHPLSLVFRLKVLAFRGKCLVFCSKSPRLRGGMRRFLVDNLSLVG